MNNRKNNKSKTRKNNNSKTRKNNNSKTKKIKNLKCDEIETKLTFSQTNKFLKELGKGTYGIAFKGCLDFPEPICKDGISIKYISISKSHNISVDDKTHPSNVEYLIGKELASLVYSNITPHINITIHNLKCQFNNLINSVTFTQPKAREWLKLTQEKLSDDKIFPIINVVFNELANMNLQEYISNNYSIMSHQDHLILLFQFCYTLLFFKYSFSSSL